MFQKTSIQTTDQMHVNDPSDDYYPETETNMSQITSMKTTEQMHINNSLDYIYYSETETKKSQTTNITTTEQMYIDNYPDYKIYTESNSVTDENTTPIDQSHLDGRRRRRTTRNKKAIIKRLHRTDRYIYAKPSITPRNRHDFFYNKYHYGWRCKYLGHKRCVNICHKFFQKLCAEVTACNGAEKYDVMFNNLCQFRCNISFYRPDFNKKLFVRTKKPRVRRSSFTPKPNFRAEEEYQEKDKLRYPEPKFRAEEYETEGGKKEDKDDIDVETEETRWHISKSRLKTEDDETIEDNKKDKEAKGEDKWRNLNPNYRSEEESIENKDVESRRRLKPMFGAEEEYTNR